MKQVVVDVPDNQLAAFVQYLKRKHYQLLVSIDVDIPDAHKTIVRERRANSKPENLLNWENVKDNFKLE